MICAISAHAKRTKFMPPINHFRLLCGAGFFLLAAPAQATNYAIESDVIGNVSHYTVKEGENLYDLARRYDLGIVEMLAANPNIDPWMPEKGTRLALTTSHVLPSVPREGIVINLAELRLFYFAGKDAVASFPIGIGQQGWPTPLGMTKVKYKRSNPSWTPPDSIRAQSPDLPETIGPGDQNPLGAYALYLEWPRFLIHGTNRPSGVGKRSSHGCIRLYAEDIAQLYAMVPVGTTVTVIDAPYKLGWKNGRLYLEVTPTQDQSDAIAHYAEAPTGILAGLDEAILTQAGDRLVDWQEVEDAVAKPTGIPVAITY